MGGIEKKEKGKRNKGLVGNAFGILFHNIKGYALVGQIHFQDRILWS